jgi:hypothetical protein
VDYGFCVDGSGLHFGSGALEDGDYAGGSASSQVLGQT